MIRVQLSGNVDAALNRLGAITGRGALQPILLRAGKAAAAAAEGVAVTYPKPSGKPLPLYYTRQDKNGRSYKSKFKSQAQQGLVMALARAGLIPRPRTGLLGRSITSRVEADGNVVIVYVGTNIPYAPPVIGQPPVQSHYHQGSWTPMADNLRNNVDVIRRAAEAEIVAGIREHLAGK